SKATVGSLAPVEVLGGTAAADQVFPPSAETLMPSPGPELYALTKCKGLSGSMATEGELWLMAGLTCPEISTCPTTMGAGKTERRFRLSSSSRANRDIVACLRRTSDWVDRRQVLLRDLKKDAC